MATKKTYKVTFTVKTLGGTTFTATDSDEGKFGTIAFAQFKDYKTVEIGGGESGVTYVPFHAIEYVTVTETSADATYEDNTCK